MSSAACRNHVENWRRRGSPSWIFGDFSLDLVGSRCLRVLHPLFGFSNPRDDRHLACGVLKAASRLKLDDLLRTIGETRTGSATWKPARE